MWSFGIGVKSPKMWCNVCSAWMGAYFDTVTDIGRTVEQFGGI